MRVGEVLWILEAKDPQDAFSARQIADSVRDFHGDGSKGYVGRLLSKVDDVEQNPTGVADALQVPDPDGSWKVRGMIVTRRPIAAAYVPDSKVPFSTLKHVLRDMHSLR